MNNTKYAVFLDRDGTIIKEVEYLSDPDLLEILPNADKGLLLLKKSGFLNIIITNQSAIGRGIITHGRLEEIHYRLKSLLLKRGVELDGIYYCPHHPEDHCDCRKPANKMLLQAAKDHDIDLAKSFVVGDRLMDVMMGKSVGAKTAIVSSKWTSLDGEHKSFGADFVGKDLLQVARWIKNQRKK